MNRRGVCGLALLLLCLWGCGVAWTQTQPPFSPQGDWSGVIHLPTGDLGVEVTLVDGDEGWSGRIDIPAQHAKDLPLADIVIDASRIQFSIAAIPGNPTFKGVPADGRITGRFTQGGAGFPFELARGAGGQMNSRPQTPRPPYPYETREVSFQSQGVTLAGTLTIPAGDGPFPGVVMLTGSGAQNRNEELFGHKPFLVLADYLTRYGIATLRWDDRGVGKSGGKLSQATLSELAADALAAIDLLAKQDGVNAARIGILGHSKGGLVAAVAAADSEQPAFLVLLAAPGLPLIEVLPNQLRFANEVHGVPAEVTRKMLDRQQALLAAIAAGKSEARIEPLLEDLIALQLEQKTGQRPPASALDKITRAKLADLTSPAFRSMLTADPTDALKQVEAPVLALNGSLDSQVDAEANLQAIEAALHHGGNDQVTARVLPGLNHLFQPAKTGAVSEYAVINTTMSPKVLSLIAKWINSPGE